MIQLLLVISPLLLGFTLALLGRVLMVLASQRLLLLEIRNYSAALVVPGPRAQWSEFPDKSKVPVDPAGPPGKPSVEPQAQAQTFPRDVESFSKLLLKLDAERAADKTVIEPLVRRPDEP